MCDLFAFFCVVVDVLGHFAYNIAYSSPVSNFKVWFDVLVYQQKNGVLNMFSGFRFFDSN